VLPEHLALVVLVVRGNYSLILPLGEYLVTLAAAEVLEVVLLVVRLVQVAAVLVVRTEEE
jgi:hypothetical protein